MTRMLVVVSAAIEAATGAALIAVPDVVARILLGTGLSGSGMAVARVAGLGLLSLAIASWPGNGDATPQVIRALFVYNLLAGLYLGYLRVGGAFTGYLLWPACALHVVMGFLLVRPAYESVSFASANRAGPH
jgi:hypothetical protein